MMWVLALAAFALGFGACMLLVYVVQSRNLPGPGVHTGPMLAAPDFPAREVAASARRRPSRVENEAAAGGAPGFAGPGDVPAHNLLTDAELRVLTPAHPRFGQLLDTPGDGFDAVRPDGTIRVGAHERNVRPRRAPGHAPWSESLPVLDEAAEAEQRRVDFARSQLEQHDPADITPELLQDVLDSLRAMPVYGEKPVATVLEAERLAEVTLP